jgi:hypothetical protein
MKTTAQSISILLVRAHLLWLREPAAPVQEFQEQEVRRLHEVAASLHPTRQPTLPPIRAKAKRRPRRAQQDSKVPPIRGNTHSLE